MQICPVLDFDNIRACTTDYDLTKKRLGVIFSGCEWAGDSIIRFAINEDLCLKLLVKYVQDVLQTDRHFLRNP